MTLNSTPLTDSFAEQGADFIEIYGTQLPLRCGNAGDEYQAARESTLICDGGHRALVKADGNDLIDFLQRVLSSDLTKLNTNTSQLSAMLDGKGHWIAELVLFRLEDRDGQAQILIDLPQACLDQFMQKIDMFTFDEDVHFAPYHCARIRCLGQAPELPDSALTLARPDCGIACTEIVCDADSGAEILQSLIADGHKIGGWVAQDILRVEGGFPLWGSDFDESYTLPGANEWRRSSITKGCYAGQEVVARINTYGEAPRQLCNIKFEGEAMRMQGAVLSDDKGAEVGHVSSWIYSPHFDAPIAFAYLKRKVAQNGHNLIATLNGVQSRCTVNVPDKVFG
ncbi:MAG: glycine cleavage T C-terminal barrel domain-containing protein [Planctomycetota bacterium]|nr:glycine cleavage T C-terminal barrel domain-containing protein [Planctomycetota bacterium]